MFEPTETHEPEAAASLGAELERIEAAIGAIQTQLGSIRHETVERSDAADWVCRLERARERLTQASMSMLADFEARLGPAFDGHRNAATWLVARTGTRRQIAGARAHLARRLVDMPHTDAAFASGEITEAHCRLLLRLDNPRTHETFIEHESALVAWAASMTADEFAHFVEAWLQLHDPDGSEPRDESVDRLHYSETLDGRLKGDFDLGGEPALIAKAVLDAKVKQLAARDADLKKVDPSDPLADQRHSERAARALVELLESGASLPGTAAARRPLLTVHTTMATIAGTASPAEALIDIDEAWRSPIPVELLQRWACDSHVARAVFGPDGELLDLGRSARTASDAQRRALAARDRGCAVPGCDQAVVRCDAHHVEWWEADGPTDIGNLVLLCRHHHTRIHGGDLHVVMDEVGLPVFVLPGGRRLVPPDPPGSDPPGNDPPRFGLAA